jgi:hypothetical protein
VVSDALDSSLSQRFGLERRGCSRSPFVQAQTHGIVLRGPFTSTWTSLSMLFLISIGVFGGDEKV